MIDVQRDFCPGGALPVDRGDEVVPTLNEALAAARQAGVQIFVSRDWHPRGHVSFTERGGDWPPHCIQDSPGAQFHPTLRIPEEAAIVSKGTRFDKDQYSAFNDTGLDVELRARGVRRVWLGGLALDVCVRATALDARRHGFETILITDASAPLTPESGQRAIEEMQAAGILVAAWR